MWHQMCVRKRSWLLLLAVVVLALAGIAVFSWRYFSQLSPPRALHVDPVYERGARETGGAIIDARGLASGDPAAIQNIVRAAIAQLSNPNTDDTLLLAYGDPTSQVRNYEISVDPSVERVWVSTLLAGLPTHETISAELVDPTGHVVDQRSQGVEISPVNNGKVFSLQQPAPGLWHVRITSGAAYSLHVMAATPVQFLRFDFVELQEGPDGGYFPIHGILAAGAAHIVEAAVSQEQVRVLSLTFIDEQANRIGEARLFSTEEYGPLMTRGDVYGQATVPSRPFRVMVRGLYRAQPFQRVLGRLYTPNTRYQPFYAFPFQNSGDAIPHSNE